MPRVGDSVLGCCQTGHIARMHSFFVSLLFALAWIGQNECFVLVFLVGGACHNFRSHARGGGGSGAGVLSCSEHAIFLLIVFSKIGLGLDGFR